MGTKRSKKQSIQPVEPELTPAQVEKNEETEGFMTEMFSDPVGEAADLTKIDRRAKASRKAVLIGGIVLLLLAGTSAIAGFFVFNADDNTFQEKGVRCEFEGETEVVSGADVLLTVACTNSESVSLTGMVAEVTYPQGFTYESANYGPSGEYFNQWQIGELLPGESKKLEIIGHLIGEVGSSHNFSAFVSYRPANFNSEFQERLDWELVVDSSTLEVSLKGLQEVISGQASQFTITYRNTSDRALSRIRIKADWPDQVKLESASPSADADGSWLITQLSPNESGTISGSAIFAGEVGDQQETLLSLGLMESDGKFNLQVEKSFLTLFINPEITIAISDAKLTSLDWGKTYTPTIELTNGSDFPLTEATISATVELMAGEKVLDEEWLDWSTLINESKGKRDGYTFVWSSTELTQLETFTPGQKINVSWAVNLLKEQPSGLVGEGASGARVTVTLSGKRENGEESVAFTKTKVGDVLPMSATPTISSEARYYDEGGVPVGSGPFPPVASRPTTFTVLWSLNNTGTDVTGIEVSTTLPADVQWLGQAKVSAGEPLTYDAKTRSVTWRLNKLPAWSGGNGSAVTAEFDISVTPLPEDIGSYVPLTEEIVLSGTDSVTKEAVTDRSPAEDTRLSDDSTANEKGRVIGQGS